MIKKIDLTNEALAEALVKLQYTSYMVEAALMNFYEIPPLKDTVKSLQSSKERFYGCFWENDGAGNDDNHNHLVAAIAVKLDNKTLDICRVVVHPDYFRKGIASEMIRFVENCYTGIEKIIVSTGSKNLPAIGLYKHLGFSITGEKEIAPGVSITLLEKRLQ